ncbi:ChaN family lipoprotein [Leisingera daeponensis]|uniref:ChaN family lipoprotein n=1 Tax=Leisingera daeponensis TaxID=405746 RepID=UPI001C97B023|nr:ChaN family lipoprotein [Leisingera daeponensis]MBY6057591.1 ChaN family lipoprotein [Leisingera daeponensis]
MRKRNSLLKIISSAAALAALGLSGARADSVSAAADALRGADVVILGEVHDNAVHHLRQAALLSALEPKAVVWEMLTAEQAAKLEPGTLADAEQTESLFDWAASGWPEFTLYAPVFAAAKGARQYGALVLREQATEAMEQGAAAFFGATASARFGLDQPLPEEEQAVREADQLDNHCNAMPQEMLPVLVDFQRLRDASLAAAADKALTETGGPVAVITGNGHARTDRGIAVYLAMARPDADIRSLGQSEDGQISGVFDLVLDAQAAERPDPCLAFRKNG